MVWLEQVQYDFLASETDPVEFLLFHHVEIAEKGNLLLSPFLSI
jgi:hypothetical protein